jgi:FKBP-type peptidyl-prolyl cis-trans isomerase FklB
MGFFKKLFKIKSKRMETNLKEGQDFLAANKAKPGVTELPSGLQYQILTEGTGPKPTANNNVKCHYHGTLIDGTVFDSSVQRGQPASFPLNQVIKGWTEGLQLMSVGSKWRFFIPPHLGYGDRQAGPKIGAYSTLIFDVELLGIN